MGKRKRISADKLKEARRSQYYAKLNDVPTSPRKMRLVVDLVRGKEAFQALGILKFTKKEAARRLEGLLKSAIANWEQKTEQKADQGKLYISTIYVNEATMLKRLRPAPQGRGHRIRKRSNHVALYLDTINTEEN